MAKIITLVNKCGQSADLGPGVIKVYRMPLLGSINVYTLDVCLKGPGDTVRVI